MPIILETAPSVPGVRSTGTLGYYSPIPINFAADLYAALEPIAYDDGAQGYALQKYCAALAEPFAQAELYATDTVDAPGWTIMLDATRAPIEVLPWLAQFIGVTPRKQGESEAALRAKIQDSPSLNRGTREAIITAAKSELTGTKSVTVTERDGSAYRLSILTRTDETPDTPKLTAAILAVKPAGIVLNLVVSSSNDYAALDASHTTYAATDAAYTTYEDMLTI